MSCWAVIVAAGRGTRAGLGQNKVFQPLEGRTVLARCLDAFERCGRFDGVALVLSPEDEGRFDELTRREGPFPLVKRTARGGATRRDSVYNGLMALPEDAQIVAIHDAARPFVTGAVIDATLESARAFGSGVICTPVEVASIAAAGGQPYEISSKGRGLVRANIPAQTTAANTSPVPWK